MYIHVHIHPKNRSDIIKTYNLTAAPGATCSYFSLNPSEVNGTFWVVRTLIYNKPTLGTDYSLL